MSTFWQLFTVAMLLFANWIAMLLWNGIVPDFGGPTIDYWHSLALMVLGRIYTFVPPSLFRVSDDRETPQ